MNSIIRIEVCERDKLNLEKIIGQCIERIESRNDCDEYNNGEITLEKLRDAIGISKVIVKRMEAFVQMLKPTFCVDEYYDFLSKNYIKAEYLRLKGKGNEEVSKIINEIEEKDICFANDLIKELKKYICIG